MKQPKSIQISIPQPCTENWDKMTPQQQGRFCDSCQKCVVDFTGFTDEQLYRFFAEHKGQKVCGRMKKAQLNRAIVLPPQPHSTLYKWVIAAGLALVFVATPETGTFAKIPFAFDQCFDAKDDSTSNNGFITGYTTNKDGRNIRGIKVTISEGGRIIQETYSNEKGEYFFTEILAGRYDIHAEGDGFRKHTVTMVMYSAQHPIEVNLKLKKGNKRDNPTESIYNVPPIDKYHGANLTFITGRVELEKMKTIDIKAVQPTIDDLVPKENPDTKQER